MEIVGLLSFCLGLLRTVKKKERKEEMIKRRKVIKLKVWRFFKLFLLINKNKILTNNHRKSFRKSNYKKIDTKLIVLRLFN